MTDAVDAPNDPRGPAALVAQILDHLGSLLRKEIELARKETSEKLGQATGALGWLAAALVSALVALNVLAAAVVLALIDGAGLSPVWAALAVGLVLAVVAALVAAKGVRDLKPENLAPERTVRTLRHSAETIKETFHD